MKRLRKISIWICGIVIGLYLIVCIGMFLLQEKFIFHPKKLEANHTYRLTQSYEEIFVPAEGIKVHGLLIKCDSARGLIFYLHGNAGTTEDWSHIAKNYGAFRYDVFIMDYRGFGKSEGEITSEKQFYQDVRNAYEMISKRYAENKIVVIGYSIGTASAAMLGAEYHPKEVILQAPYFSLTDMMHQTYSFVPDFLLKYPFETWQFLPKIKSPLVIFHGDADEIIYYGSSLQLKKYFKRGDTLITLPGAGHLGINDNPLYLQELKRVLN